MLRETFRKAADSALRWAMHSMGYETMPGIKGEIFWEMRCSVTGKVTKGHLKNVVVRDASILLARFMKGTGTSNPNQCEPRFGVFALMVGTGDVAWNPLAPPPATTTQRSLYNELARKQVASTSYITEGGTVSGVPTNVVDFTTTFSESEAVGALTEMGLCGGDLTRNMAVRNPILPPNGSYDPTVNVVGKDMLINYVTFPAISKPATSTLSWTWRLTF